MRKILYSPGYGAGWVSWHRSYPASSGKEECLFMLEDPELVSLVESKILTEKAFTELWGKRFPGREMPYLGGMEDLTVMEVPDGRRVRIDEYDGSESVTVEGEYEGWL